MTIPERKPGSSIGVAVSAAGLRAVLLDEHGNIIKESTDKLNAAEETLPQLVSYIKAVISYFGEYSSIGLAVPGLVDRAENRLVHSVYFPELSEAGLKEELDNAVGSNVYIENDANAAAIAEYSFGAGKDSSNLFYAMLDAGVGGAFILNNELWRGASGYAGEFGHIAIDTEGNRLEHLASAANIIRRTQERTFQDSTSSISQLHEGDLSVSNIIDAAENEDDLAIMMLARTGSYVGVAIADVINLFDPGLIIIGGQTAGAGENLLDAIKEKAKELAFAEGFDKTNIIFGDLGANAAAAGAAYLAATSSQEAAGI